MTHLSTDNAGQTHAIYAENVLRRERAGSCFRSKPALTFNGLSRRTV